jgi:hypothetical protein
MAIFPIDFPRMRSARWLDRLTYVYGSSARDECIRVQSEFV